MSRTLIDSKVRDLAEYGMLAGTSGHRTRTVILKQYALGSITGSSCTSAALVVGNSGALSATDTYVQGRLVALGYTVTIVDDAAGADLSRDLVVIAESCTSASVGSKYSTFAGGVLTLEGGVVDDMNMAAGPTHNTGAQSTVDIIDAGHALAGGLSGSGVTVLGTADSINFSDDVDLAGSVQKVIAPPGLTGTSTICYAYETGATMLASHVAEGRRVFIGFVMDAFGSTLNANGQAVLDAAIAWACGRTGINAAPLAGVFQDADPTDRIVAA